ncbi:unnamed protein product, partial [Tilletia controversa]
FQPLSGLQRPGAPKKALEAIEDELQLSTAAILNNAQRSTPTSHTAVNLTTPNHTATSNPAGPAPETVARIATGAAAQYALPPPSAAGSKPRRFFRSVVGYSLVLGTVFYTGSTVAALNNDLFVESVPGGEAILDQLSSRNLDRSLTFSTKDADVSSLTNRAIGLGRSAIGSVSEAVDRTFLQTQEKARQAEHRAREAAASFQDQASRTAREAADKVSAAGQRTKEAVNHEGRGIILELEQSLEVKNDLISAHLKEEVVSRGIELQKQWMSGVKAAVEKERGARLAQIEQLTEEAAVLDKLALENENILAESARVRTLTAAVRALSSAALGGVEGASSSGDDSLYAYRTPFRAQIDALRGTASKGPSADVYEAALSSLEAGGVNPDEGVESETTLQTWFKRRVAPKVLSVALLPDPTVAPPSSTSAEGVLAPQPRSPGLFAHLVSATLSPLLAKKTPSEALVLASQDGKDDDIPTVLARAEFWLEKGRLEDAVREVNRLKGWGKTLSADWLAEARKRLVVQQAVERRDDGYQTSYLSGGSSIHYPAFS